MRGITQIVILSIFDFTDIETDTLEESKEILFGLLLTQGGLMMVVYLWIIHFSITAICDQVMPSIDDEINAGYGHLPDYCKFARNKTDRFY